MKRWRRDSRGRGGKGVGRGGVGGEEEVGKE